MTRQLSLAIGSAVALAVVAATVALALNTGFVGASSADAAEEEAPVTTTTTYEQYLEEWYAANPTTTSVAPVTTSTTTTLEPVVIYEYVDIPVSVPPPEVIYVPVPVEPTTTQPPASTPTTTPTTGGGSEPSPTVTTTTRPPTTTGAAMELLEFDVYGFADVTVASHGPGDRLQFWLIEQDSPWVWEIEADNGSEIEVKFFNTATEKEAKFELRIRDDGYRLKTEGDGFEEQERNL